MCPHFILKDEKRPTSRHTAVPIDFERLTDTHREQVSLQEPTIRMMVDFSKQPQKPEDKETILSKFWGGGGIISNLEIYIQQNFKSGSINPSLHIQIHLPGSSPTSAVLLSEVPVILSQLWSKNIK